MCLCVCAGGRVLSGGADHPEGPCRVLRAGGRPAQPRVAVSRGGSVALRERSLHVEVSRCHKTCTWNKEHNPPNS